MKTLHTFKNNTKIGTIKRSFFISANFRSKITEAAKKRGWRWVGADRCLKTTKDGELEWAVEFAKEEDSTFVSKSEILERGVVLKFVDYNRKEEAKEYGAVWSSEKKAWMMSKTDADVYIAELKENEILDENGELIVYEKVKEVKEVFKKGEAVFGITNVDSNAEVAICHETLANKFKTKEDYSEFELNQYVAKDVDSYQKYTLRQILEFKEKEEKEEVVLESDVIKKNIEKTIKRQKKEMKKLKKQLKKQLKRESVKRI